MFRSTTASVRDRERQAAAQVFRARHHISQEDTMSLGSMEDITRAVGRVEQPASVRILCELFMWTFWEFLWGGGRILQSFT